MEKRAAAATVVRAGASLALLAYACPALTSAGLQSWRTRERGTPLDRLDSLLAAGGGLTAAVLLGWVGLVLAAAVLACLPGRVGVLAGRRAYRASPRLLRAVLVGASVSVVGTTGCGPAEDLPEMSRPQTALAQDESTTLVPSPDSAHTSRAEPPPRRPRPTPSPALARDNPAAARGGPASPAPRTSVAPTEVVVVHVGDTLWDIAQRRLGPDARPVDVAAAWPRWYRANRAQIGPDPDLLHPGMELVAPGQGQPNGSAR